MHTHARHLTVGLAAALMLALGVGAASARSFSITEQSIRVVWSPLTFDAEGMAEVRCNVTLEGSFHYRTIVKNGGHLVGHITRAIVGRPCARNTAWVYNGTERNEVLGGGVLGSSFPWPFTYESFEGTLPNITRIHVLLVDVGILMRVATILGTILCQYIPRTANGVAEAIATINAGRLERLEADPARRIRSETPGCPEGRFSGTGPVTGLNSGNIITVRLI